MTDGPSGSAAAVKDRASPNAPTGRRPGEGCPTPWEERAAAPAAGKKQISSSGLSRLARKIISREWARAKGTLGGRLARQRVARFEREAAEYQQESERKKRMRALALGRAARLARQRVARFEREAAQYQQEKERKKRMRALALERAARLSGSLQEAMSAFGPRLCEVPLEERADRAEDLLAEAVRCVGDVDHIHWAPDGCEITFEPWEERRLRRKDRAARPVLFVARVDEHLRLTDCTWLEGKRCEASRRESIVDRIYAALWRHGRTPQVLRDALCRVGRIIGRREMNDGGIKTGVEPWEEVRRRRIKRSGWSPARVYLVSADAALENIRCEPCFS